MSRSALHRLSTAVGKLLRLPSEPRLPPLSRRDSVHVFSPPPKYFWYQLFRTQAGAVFGIAFGVWAFSWIPEVGSEILRELPRHASKWFVLGWIEWIEVIGLVGFLLQLMLTLFVLGLDLRHRWYVVTDASLHVCSGVWNVEERTMSLVNLQSLSIRQGPIQRLFGIADVQVESAGGGGNSMGDDGGRSSQGLHVSTFRGVDNAESIRDLIRRSLEELDESEAPSPDQHKVSGLAEALAGAEAMLAEATALTRAVASRAAPQRQNRAKN